MDTNQLKSKFKVGDWVITNAQVTSTFQIKSVWQWNETISFVYSPFERTEVEKGNNGEWYVYEHILRLITPLEREML